MKGAWVFLGLLLIGGLPTLFYVGGPGGVALALPINLMTWFSVSVLALVCGMFLSVRTCSVGVWGGRVGAAGTSIFLLPLLYTRPGWQISAGWRALGLIAGLIFYFICLQLPIRNWQRRLVLYLILITSGIQALLGLLQLFAPSIADYWVPLATTRAVGIFHQG